MTGISQDLSSWPLRTSQPVRMGHAPASFPIRRLAEDPAHVLDRPSVDRGTCPLSHLRSENGSDHSRGSHCTGLWLVSRRRIYRGPPQHPIHGVAADHLQLVRNAGATRRGYFLRAETMHGFFTYLEKNPSTVGTDISFHDMSHGESFLELAVDRFRGRGLWVLDEPESALSFAGCLSLLAVLKDLLAEGSSQVIMSTHSPVLAALPGAQILEVGPWGLRQQEWSDLDLVSNWRSFLDSPERYLRHL